MKNGASCILFRENHLQVQGFSEHYHDDIHPILEVADARRRKAWLKVILYGLVSIVLVFSAGYGLWRLDKFDPFFVYAMTPITSAVVVFGIWNVVFKPVQNTIKDTVVGTVCAFFDWEFTRDAKEISTFSDFKDFGLLPTKYGDIYWQDQIWGEAYDTRFDATELLLLDGNAFIKGKKSVAVFRGTLFRIDFYRKVYGQTVVLRSGRVFTPERKGKMKRVGLVDPVFKKAFQAYGTDQVEARVLLSPDFMQRLVDLEASVEGKNMRFGFIKGQLLVAIETPNRFEAGSMLRPLTNPVRTQKILDEVGAIYDVVDGILAPQDLT